MKKSVLSLIFFLSLNFASYAKQNYSIEYKVFPNHQEIHFSGEMKTPWESKKELNAVLDKLEKNKNTLVYITKSWGGVIATYKKMIKKLKEACDGNQCLITTYVKEYCGSACVDLLMAGDIRMMRHNAKLGFHRAWVIHPSIPIKSKKKMGNEYKAMGANPEWIDNNLDIFEVSKKTAFGVSAKWLFWRDARDAEFINEWSPTSYLEVYRADHK